jgi:prophage regulatory protein
MEHSETNRTPENPIESDLQKLLTAIRKAAWTASEVPELQKLMVTMGKAARPPPIEQALLRPAAASAFIGVSRTTLHRLSESDPTFPRKIVIGPRCVGYTPKSLTNWLAAKAQE